MGRPCPAGVAGRIAFTYGKEGRPMGKFPVLQSSTSTSDDLEEALTRFEVWRGNRKTSPCIPRFLCYAAFNDCSGIPANPVPVEIPAFDKKAI
jgi:hypothetical protein